MAFLIDHMMSILQMLSLGAAIVFVLRRRRRRPKVRDGVEPTAPDEGGRPVEPTTRLVDTTHERIVATPPKPSILETSPRK